MTPSPPARSTCPARSSSPAQRARRARRFVSLAVGAAAVLAVVVGSLPAAAAAPSRTVPDPLSR